MNPTHPDNRELNRLITAGYTNKQIREELGTLSKDRIYNCRRQLGCMQDRPRRSRYVEDEADIPGRFRHTKRWGKSCPKCGGAVVTGGVRFSVSAPDLQTCFACGLNNESLSYVDVTRGMRVEI